MRGERLTDADDITLLWIFKHLLSDDTVRVALVEGDVLLVDGTVILSGDEADVLQKFLDRR